jgi:type III secretory pathway component EscV
MSSKQLAALIRKAPPATVPDEEVETSETAAEPKPAPKTPEPARAKPAAAKKKVAEPEVPIQVKLPLSVQKQLYHMSVEEGVSLRTMILRAIQHLGIEVPQDELNSRRRKLP